MYHTEDDAREATVSRAQALAELKRHYMGPEEVAEFLKEVGDKEFYTGSEVLDWLGY